MALLMAISGKERETSDRWILALQGLLGLGVGALTWFSPAITALSLLLYIAAWTLATGVLQIVAAIKLRKEIPNEWWLILAGLVSIAFAFLVLWQPVAGALAVLWLIGSWAIVCGVLLIGVGLRLRRARRRLARSSRPEQHFPFLRGGNPAAPAGRPRHPPGQPAHRATIAGLTCAEEAVASQARASRPGAGVHQPASPCVEMASRYRAPTQDHRSVALFQEIYA